MTKEQAAKKKAEWLAKCLDFGWSKNDLEGLSNIWDKFKDENGNMRPSFKDESPAPADGWVRVSDRLPEDLQTVWLANDKGFVCLGCLVRSDGGYHWAEGNGLVYSEDRKIVSECESEDLDVTIWHPLPLLPQPPNQ